MCWFRLHVFIKIRVRKDKVRSQDEVAFSLTSFAQYGAALQGLSKNRCMPAILTYPRIACMLLGVALEITLSSDV